MSLYWPATTSISSLPTETKDPAFHLWMNTENCSTMAATSVLNTSGRRFRWFSAGRLISPAALTAGLHIFWRPSVVEVRGRASAVSSAERTPAHKPSGGLRDETHRLIKLRQIEIFGRTVQL